MASCILFQNTDQTITLLDIPRSIELAQGFHDKGRKRLLSSEAVEWPFPSVEPKSAKALLNVEIASIQDLLLHRHLELSLQEAKKTYKGPWCSPRVLQADASMRLPTNRKRHTGDSKDLPSQGELTLEWPTIQHASGQADARLPLPSEQQGIRDIYHNIETVNTQLKVGTSPITVYIPPLSTYIHGDINKTCNIFNSKAPQFNLVIMDPPWPNRSARRKQSYRVSHGIADIAALLSSIPLNSHLAEDALVGIWVTNKPTFHELLLGPNGFFEKWGLDLVEEWIWLKVTTSGEPICALNNTWRKPFEVLLLGRKRGSSIESTALKRRVIISVPEVHSRKPNLQTMFKPMLPSKYEALEIFARNLTAGWWGWGNEVLKFQCVQYWLP